MKPGPVIPLLAVALVASSASTASTVFAGDPALAEQLFEAGLALRDEGKIAEACEKFAASMDAEPSGGAALNVGRCAEEDGRTATAWAAYKRAIVLFQATNEGDRRMFAEEQAARVEPSISTLTIEVPDIDGLRLTRNGEDVPAAAIGTAVPVDPGEQIVEARAEGYETATLTVSVEPDGAAETITIPELTPLPERASPGPSPDRSTDDGVDPLVVSGGVLLGVGAAAAIVGGVLGGLVLSDASKARELCDGNVCDQGDDGREGKAIAESAKGKALASDILVIGGSVVGVGGAVLLIVGLTSGDGEPATGLSVVPLAEPTLVGVRLGGAF